MGVASPFPGGTGGLDVKIDSGLWFSRAQTWDVEPRAWSRVAFVFPVVAAGTAVSTHGGLLDRVSQLRPQKWRVTSHLDDGRLTLHLGHAFPQSCGWAGFVWSWLGWVRLGAVQLGASGRPCYRPGPSCKPSVVSSWGWQRHRRLSQTQLA